jgi:Bacterial Ig-like domain (group 3)
MRGLRMKHLALLAALAVGVTLVLVGSAAAAQAYGVAVSKGCVSPINVGDAYSCTAELDNNNSTSQDTVRVTALDDEVDSSTGAHVTSIPINSSTPGLVKLDLGGGLPTCDPTGCTLLYNQGIEVTFSHYTTVIGDFPNVADTATYHWNDTCTFIAPGTACSTGPKTNQAGASADINQLPTTTTTSINQVGGNSGVTAVEVGSSVTDSVTVHAPNNQPPPTGNVTVNFYSTIDCSGNPVDAASTDALDANGQALNVHPEGPLAAGLYSYRAVYAGNGPYAGSTGDCEPLRVVDANIQITPANATNPIGTNHVLTGHVNVNDGSGFVNAPDGTVISFSLSNAGGASATFVGPSTCTTAGGTGSCTVTISSPTAGTTTIHDTTTVGVSGVSLTRSSGDGHAGDSPNATKLWIAPDANIQISPLNAANEVGTNHVLTGHVNVSTDGTTFQNAPDGTTINFSLTNANGATAAFVGPSSCTTAGGTGSCTVTISSPTAGQTTISDTTTVTVIGVPLTRSSGDGLPGDSANAGKTWVDANIQVTPASAENPVGTNHTLTGHVNVNDGSGAGFVNAPDGTVISFSLTNAGGASATFVGPSTCTTAGGTGSCTVQISSPTAGTTTVNASSTVSVVGISLTRTTNATGANSGPATKLWASVNVVTHVRDANGNDLTGSTTVAPGTVVHDEATVTRGAGTPAAVPDPTGTVTFTLFSGLTCNGAVQATDPNEPLGAGGIASSVTFTTTSGDFSYLAHYNGDANYPAADAACEPFTVSNPFSPALTPGFWKNHQAATTALLPVSLGNYLVDTFAKAVAIFNAMNCSQPINCLAGHLLAAELDLKSGSNPSIQPTIDKANAFLSGGVADGVTGVNYTGVGNYTLTAAQKAEALKLEALIDAYTNA